jgi:hypothetical protein
MNAGAVAASPRGAVWDAMNTGDAEVIAKTIDELVEPDVRRHDD